MGNLALSLDELQFDLANPRFEGLARNQREALQRSVQSQGDKFFNLAEDIISNGMSPAHRLLVIKAPGMNAMEYTVVDGNRRLAVLRVLANPEVLEGLSGVGYLTAQKMRLLAREFSLKDVEPLDAFLCKDEHEARHWLEAIHTGENDGRGVIRWDAVLR